MDNDFIEVNKEMQKACKHIDLETGKPAWVSKDGADTICKICKIKYTEYLYRTEEEQQRRIAMAIQLKCNHTWPDDGSDATIIENDIRKCQICKKIFPAKETKAMDQSIQLAKLMCQWNGIEYSEDMTYSEACDLLKRFEYKPKKTSEKISYMEISKTKNIDMKERCIELAEYIHELFLKDNQYWEEDIDICKDLFKSIFGAVNEYLNENKENVKAIELIKKEYFFFGAFINEENRILYTFDPKDIECIKSIDVNIDPIFKYILNEVANQNSIYCFNDRCGGISYYEIILENALTAMKVIIDKYKMSIEDFIEFINKDYK
jgi:hypothetical protein